MNDFAIEADNGRYVSRFGKTNQSDLIEIKVRGNGRGIFFPSDDADGGGGVAGSDGSSSQAHAFVSLAAHSIAAVGPFSCRLDDEM